MISLRLKKNYLLKNLTTMKVGGPAKYFINVKNEKDLIETIKWASKKRIKWLIIGDGSNLIPSDKGFNGLVIKNEIEGFKRAGNKVFVGAGNKLFTFIHKANQLGLSGMEKMTGIPGTIGGAIYGCAGAYGHEIKNNLLKVRIYDGKIIRWLSKKQCRFGYRESVFKKKKDWIILSAEFEFEKDSPKKLNKISKEIVKIRGKKYPPKLACPGSFFKNILINNVRPLALRRKLLQKIDKSKIRAGKLPVGYLLEEIGAKGMKCGKIKVAEYHGNLIFNTGGGKSSEILKLAKILKQKVKNKFDINLEEEIQYI